MRPEFLHYRVPGTLERMTIAHIPTSIDGEIALLQQARLRGHFTLRLKRTILKTKSQSQCAELASPPLMRRLGGRRLISHQMGLEAAIRHRFSPLPHVSIARCTLATTASSLKSLEVHPASFAS